MPTVSNIQLPPDSTGKKVKTILDEADSTLHNPTTVIVDETGATVAPATEGTVGARFGGGKLQRATAISTLGDNTILTPASGKYIRLYWLGLATSQDNGAETLAIVKFGATTLYRWPLGNPGAFAHWEIVEGAVDQALVINLSAAQEVQVNYTYKEITP